MTPQALPGDRPAIEAAPAPSPGLRLRAWSGLDHTAGLERWRELDRRLGPGPLAASSLWTSIWLQTYGDLVPATILTAEAEGRTVGACLVTEGVGQAAGPVPLRTLHLGTSGEPLGDAVCVEYNDLRVEYGFRPALIAAVVSELNSRKGVDEFRMDGWAADDIAAWSDRAAPDDVRIRECPCFDLRQSRALNVEPLELLGRSTRQNLRKLLRRYGELETTWAATLDDADDILNEMIALHQARWQGQGQPGAFSSRRFTHFQRELLIHGFSEGRVVAFRVRHSGHTIGCLWLLVDRNRLLDYVSGFASFEAHASPGLITHYLCLAEAARRGFDAYDFLVGEKRHKANLSTGANQLAWAVWRRPSLRNRLVNRLRSLKSLGERARGTCQETVAPSLSAPDA